MPYVPGKVDFATLELRALALGTETGRVSPGEGWTSPWGLQRAAGNALDLMAAEHAFTRRPGETDGDLRARIRGRCGSCGAWVNPGQLSVGAAAMTPEPHKEGCLGALAEAAEAAEREEQARLREASNFARIAAARAVRRRG